MSDEGFREFHLSGKQLVFLFMTATVIAVGIFLCGVMVGRGVPVPRTEVTVISDGEGGDPTQIAAPPAVTPAPESGASDGPPVIDYGRLLESTEEPPVEQIRASSPEPRAEAPVKVETPVVKLPREAPATSVKPGSKPAAKPAAAEAPLPPPPAGNGFVVQVAAVKARAEAETIRRRLSGKGYPAFITTAASGGSTMFRVRVGKYNDRQDAERVKVKLEREERFKPWVTR
jgi:cell division septation protein DedD